MERDLLELSESEGELEALESPFLIGEAGEPYRLGETGSASLTASVGQNAANRPKDVRLVQRLINAHLPIPLAPLVEDGKCGSKTIFAIKTYQQRVVGMSPPDGRVDPGGRTFRSLSGGAVPPPQSPSPSAQPSPGPWTPSGDGPSNMRPAAWQYLLQFTKKHEGAVFHMYNNRPASSSRQDVTCGIGFRLDPREVVTQYWVKTMFYNPDTKQTPSDDQMLADWDAAAALPRTGTNLKQYADVCHLRMWPDKVYDRMAVILRDQKLPALLKSFPEDFRDFANYPAAAQVFCVSFAYGRLPFDFPKLRAAIRENNFAAAAKQCRLRGASELKNRAHAELLLTAQKVVDQRLDPDTLPPLEGSQHGLEKTVELSGYEAYEGAIGGPFETDLGASSRQFEADFVAHEATPQGERPEYEHSEYAHPDYEYLEPEHRGHELSGSEHWDQERVDANEIAVVLGRAPARLLLHQLLNSQEIRQAAMASLLGRAARRSVRVHGVNIPIPAYLRVVSHLCQEVAEQAEREDEGAKESGGGHRCECEHGAESKNSESSVSSLEQNEFQVAFDPFEPPQNIVAALNAKDWGRALSLEIQLGIRDEDELTDLIFFAKHPELPHTKLDSANPKYKQLTAEWSQILNADVWAAIQAASENTSLVVSGKEVCDNDRFYWGSNGKRLKQLVENAAKAVDLNPGLLGTIIMAETRRPLSYLTTEKVSSYHIGTDDFYEARAAIAARVPTYANVHWDKAQTPQTHLNDATTPREVKTIFFDSGSDALLATAVYLKFREVRLREIAKDLKGDFDKLPVDVRFALTRMAMAAGTAGTTPALKDALDGKDIMVRKAIPVKIYQTKRNATVRTAQAMHLSEWIFGIQVTSTTQPAQGPGPSGASPQHETGEAAQLENAFENESENAPFPSAFLDFERELPFPKTEHFHIRKKRDTAAGHIATITVDTGASVMQPASMNPWFIDPATDKLILDKSATGLQGLLSDLVLGTLHTLLDSASVSRKTAHSTDQIQLALVDLTGEKLFSPEFAGWGSTVPRDGASVSKLLSLYALHQLRFDLIQLAKKGSLTTWAELKKAAVDHWKKGRVAATPDLSKLFDEASDVTDPQFRNWLQPDQFDVNDDCTATNLIHALSFPYIGSVAVHSGLHHDKRGGFWIAGSYEDPAPPHPPARSHCTARAWTDSPIPGADGSPRIITALSVATFYTLLAQRRLVDVASSDAIFTQLSVGGPTHHGGCIMSFKGPHHADLHMSVLDGLHSLGSFDENKMASKCGFIPRKCSHDTMLVERDKFRYVAVLLSRAPAGWNPSELIVALDNIIKARNP